MKFIKSKDTIDYTIALLCMRCSTRFDKEILETYSAVMLSTVFHIMTATIWWKPILENTSLSLTVYEQALEVTYLKCFVLVLALDIGISKSTWNLLSIMFLHPLLMIWQLPRDWMGTKRYFMHPLKKENTFQRQAICESCYLLSNLNPRFWENNPSHPTIICFSYIKERKAVPLPP